MMCALVLFGSFCVPFYQVYGYDTTLFIGQQHPITVYRTGSWVCVVLVLSVICVPLANPLLKLYFIMIILLLCIISYVV